MREVLVLLTKNLADLATAFIATLNPMFLLGQLSIVTTNMVSWKASLGLLILSILVLLGIFFLCWPLIRFCKNTVSNILRGIEGLLFGPVITAEIKDSWLQNAILEIMLRYRSKNSYFQRNLGKNTQLFFLYPFGNVCLVRDGKVVAYGKTEFNFHNYRPFAYTKNGNGEEFIVLKFHSNLASLGWTRQDYHLLMINGRTITERNLGTVHYNCLPPNFSLSPSGTFKLRLNTNLDARIAA